MNIGFIINDTATERDHYTTVHLALQAHRMGHRIAFIGVSDLSCTADARMGATAYMPPKKAYRSAAVFLEACRTARPRTITSADLDVLLLRNDPCDDLVARPWAQNAAVIFGTLAAANGVLVLNDPGGLSAAASKMYFQHFPEVVRPRTIVTRDIAQVHAFFKEEGGRMILKPLQGSGGRNVFLVEEHNKGNLKQIMEAISRDGFVIAQEYLEAAVHGDIRLFMMNGRALQRNGHFAAFRRVNAKGEIRSNIKAGGRPARVKMTDDLLRIVDVVRPKLVQDGMFLVGLDIVGDKLMEVNIFSPGGLHYVSEMEGEDLFATVIEAIEHKLALRSMYGQVLSNRELACL